MGWRRDECSDHTAHCGAHRGPCRVTSTLIDRAMARHLETCHYAIEIYMGDMKVHGPSSIRQALTYVVPQLNDTVTVAGYSPSQWLPSRCLDFLVDLLKMVSVLRKLETMINLNIFYGNELLPKRL